MAAKRVKSTREGLVGKTTATGHVIQKDSWFVALPSVHALHRIVRLRRPSNELWYTAPVLDVGPWNEYDDSYVFGSERPQAESGWDTRGRPTNGAGIDLSDLVYTVIDPQEQERVEWEFIG